MPVALANLQITDMTMDQSEDSPAWFMRARVHSVDEFAMIQENDPATLSIGGEEWSLVITEKRITREFGSVDMTISAESPVVMLIAPRAGLQSYRYEVATAARVIVEEILGQAVNWEILSWTVPAGRFVIDDADPYTAASTLVGAAGAIIQSERNGTLTVRYRYPTAMNRLHLMPVDHVFTDVEDNVSVRNSYEYRRGVNRIRITDGESTFRDTLLWEVDENDDTRGVLKAYLAPWRVDYDLVYTDSDGPVSIYNRGVRTESVTEIVEFSEGTGSLKLPVYSMDSFSWLSDPLATPTVQQYSNTITAGTLVNQGYGLAEIRYTVRYNEYYLIGKLGLHAQFLIQNRE